jgi:hypothetical protein
LAAFDCVPVEAYEKEVLVGQADCQVLAGRDVEKYLAGDRYSSYLEAAVEDVVTFRVLVDVVN